jgi:hypothetical protein
MGNTRGVIMSKEKIKYCKECKEIEHDCCSLKDNNCPCCNETKEKITENNQDFNHALDFKINKWGF